MLAEAKSTFLRGFFLWGPVWTPLPPCPSRLLPTTSRLALAPPSWSWRSCWVSLATCSSSGRYSAGWRSARWRACWCWTWPWPTASCCSAPRCSFGSWWQDGAGSLARRRASWCITCRAWTCTCPSTWSVSWAWTAGWPSRGPSCLREWGPSAPCSSSCLGSGCWLSSCHCQCRSIAGKTNTDKGFSTTRSFWLWRNGKTLGNVSKCLNHFLVSKTHFKKGFRD